MKTIMTFILAFIIAGAVQAQSMNVQLDENSTMVITGTSTIHDWEADVKEILVDAALNPSALENGETLVSSLTVTVPVRAIKSGKGGMDKKIYGALDDKNHPEIVFSMNSAERSGTVGEDGSFTLDLKGDLTIAGVTRSVSFPVQGLKSDNGSYTFTGSYDMNMKDFEVDPPSAVFGTIKAGEEITIAFDMTLSTDSATARK